MSSDPYLLAILFVSSSSKGSRLVFKYPARPKATPRLARPRPVVPNQLDYAWRAAHPEEGDSGNRPFLINNNRRRERSISNATHVQKSDSGEGPPTHWRASDWGDRIEYHKHMHKEEKRQQHGTSSRKSTFSSYPQHGENDYEWVLGYRTSTLAASVFRFDRILCNQRFELVVEDLLFLGHPVCIGEDGTWQWEQLYSDAKSRNSNAYDSRTAKESTPADPKDEASLKYFHFILVLDRPDPAFGGNSNLMRFIDVYYEQITVKITAALHYEQSRDGYVEKEIELLEDLQYEYQKSEPYFEFEKRALEKSSLARAMRDIFVAVQNRRLANVTVGAFQLDLQMPWYHSELLHGDDDPDGPGEYTYANERDQRWDPGFGKGWRVPQLHPWKTLLFFENWDATVEIEPESEEMLKFREILTPDISFADAAALLDWDLETEVMRMARYMIYLKKAKISDVVHPKLLNVYVLPARFDTPLSELSAQFQSTFPPTTPALETILAAVSSSPQAFCHFVPSHDHHELYHRILIWLLRNDALIMLHVRFRLSVTRDIKEAVYRAAHSKGLPEVERGRKRTPSGLGRRENILQSTQSEIAESQSGIESTPEGRRTSPPELAKGLQPDEKDDEGPEIYVPEDFEESFIMEPGRATPLEQLWIDEIARQRPELERRFLYVCEYFDGRTTFDEIQYRSQLKRSQFRQIVSEFDYWLLTLLHP